MKTVGLYAIGDARVVDLEKPSPGPGEVVVQVKVATTCGTDLKTFLRGRPNQPFPTIPWGHECAGIIDEVGAGVVDWKPGDRVAFHNSAPCYQCYYCKRQQFELCDHLLGNWGAYAEYILIPAPIVSTAMFAMPEAMAFETASLLEPFACTVYGAARGGIRPTDSVAVIGAGFQGIGMIQLAKLYGASQIFVLDMVPSRLKLAGSFDGVTPIHVKEADPLTVIREATDGRGCDVVIEAAGTPPTWELAIDLTRKGGRVVEYGGCKGGTTISVSTERLHYHGLEIIGVLHTTPQYVRMAWDLLCHGSVDLSGTITEHTALDDIQGIYERLRDDKDQIKIALEP